MVTNGILSEGLENGYPRNKQSTGYTVSQKINGTRFKQNNFFKIGPNVFRFFEKLVEGLVY